MIRAAQVYGTLKIATDFRARLPKRAELDAQYAPKKKLKQQLKETKCVKLEEAMRVPKVTKWISVLTGAFPGSHID